MVRSKQADLCKQIITADQLANRVLEIVNRPFYFVLYENIENTKIKRLIQQQLKTKSIIKGSWIELRNILLSKGLVNSTKDLLHSVAAAYLLRDLLYSPFKYNINFMRHTQNNTIIAYIVPHSYYA